MLVPGIRSNKEYAYNVNQNLVRDSLLLAQVRLNHVGQKVLLLLFIASATLLILLNLHHALLYQLREHRPQSSVRSDEGEIRLDREPPQRNERVDEGDELSQQRRGEHPFIAFFETEGRCFGSKLGDISAEEDGANDFESRSRESRFDYLPCERL